MISFFLLLKSKIDFVIKKVNDDVELLKYQENFDDEKISVDTDYIVDETEKDNSNQDDEKEEPTTNYIGFIEINKINLKAGLVPINSKLNNVNYNVQKMMTSTYPVLEKSNLILAAHSGNSSISYFKNLYKLNVGDDIKIYYKNNIYVYRLVNIYESLKDGGVDIYRDLEKTTLTLITCTKNNKLTQTIYISELYSTIKGDDNND